MEQLGAHTREIDDVLFDFCGVLVDWEPEAALEGMFPEERLDEFFAGDDRCGLYYFDDQLDGGADLDEVIAAYEQEREPWMVEMFRAYYASSGRGLVGMLPGMEELVRDVKRTGVRVWGITNWAAGTFHDCFDKFPVIRDELQGVIVSGVEKMKKPDAGIYRLAAERFGLDPARTAFFDDNSFNVEGACAVGYRGIAFITAEHARRELRALGVEV